MRTWVRKVCRHRKRKHVPKRMRPSHRSYQCSSTRSIPGRRGRNKHHMTNKRHGGRSGANNLLLIKIGRHDSLHYYFGNLKWESIADIIYDGTWLKRRRFQYLSEQEARKVLLSIFNYHDPMQCVRMMDRISRIKGRIDCLPERQIEMLVA